jgi:transposase
MLVARHVKNLPGRKSVSDATWLAQLGAHGLVRASFVPPPPIRERSREVLSPEYGSIFVSDARSSLLNHRGVSG